jgi:hypothetical protein
LRDSKPNLSKEASRREFSAEMATLRRETKAERGVCECTGWG